MKNAETLRGEHAYAFFVYVVDASYCGSVHFWIIGSSEGDSVSFPWCFSDQVLAAPGGYNVCLRVGGLEVKCDFVLKFDVIGLVRVSFLVG